MAERAHLLFWGVLDAPPPPPPLWSKCDGRKPLKFGSSAAVDVGRRLRRRRRFGGKNGDRTDADERGVSDAGVLSVGTPS